MSSRSRMSGRRSARTRPASRRSRKRAARAISARLNRDRRFSLRSRCTTGQRTSRIVANASRPRALLESTSTTIRRRGRAAGVKPRGRSRRCSPSGHSDDCHRTMRRTGQPGRQRTSGRPLEADPGPSTDADHHRTQRFTCEHLTDVTALDSGLDSDLQAHVLGGANGGIRSVDTATIDGGDCVRFIRVSGVRVHRVLTLTLLSSASPRTGRKSLLAGPYVGVPQRFSSD